MISRLPWLHYLLTALLLIHLASTAAGQALEPVAPRTTAGEAPSSRQSGQEDDILLVVQPVTPVAVEGETPVGVDFRVTGQKESNGGSLVFPGLSDVRLKGVTRAMEAEDGTPVVQILITDIERRGDRAPLDGFGSSWAADEESDLVLSLNEQYEIEGDRQALVDALDALERDETAEAGAEEPLQVQSSGESSTEGASSGDGTGTGTGQKASINSEPPAAPDPENPEPAIETREVACGTRVDLALRVAIDQFRLEIYEDGKLDAETADDPCYDSTNPSHKYPLERDYSACAVKVDFGASKVTERFRWFYMNGLGSRIDVASGNEACIEDANTAYSITEDHGNCAVAIDYQSLTATPQSRLIYTSGDGVAHEVRSCRASASRQPVPLTLNPSLCPQPESGEQLAKYTYTLNGALHETGVCAPSGTRIETRTEYCDGDPRVDLPFGFAFRQMRTLTVQDGETVGQTECIDSSKPADRFRLERDYAACDIDVDKTARKTNGTYGAATAEYELFYRDGDDARHTINSCAPDTALSYAIVEDPAGCAISHAGDKAILQARLIYQTRDGVKHQVEACRASEDPARAPITMTFNTAVCENPDGSEPTRAFSEQGRYEYTLEGVPRTHGDCQSTGRRIEYRADHDACRVEIDEASETVFKRFKIETVIDGAVTATSACMKSAGDPGNRTMERDEAACDDRVDMTAMRKSYRFRYKYEDPHSRRTVTLSCQDDPGKSFALLEDFEACSTTHDLTAMTATPQSRIIYRKADGTAVEVRTCAASVTKEAATISEDHEGCAPTFEGGKAVPQARLVYSAADGARVEARGCAASKSRAAITMTFNTDRCENRQPSADIPFGTDGLFKYDEMGVYEYELGGETLTRGECRKTGRVIEFSRRLSCEGGYGDGFFDYERMRMSTRFGIQVHAKDKGTGNILEIIETFHGPCFTSDGFRSWPITIDYDSKHCPDRTDYTKMRYTPRGYVLAMRPTGEGGPVLADPNCRDGQTHVLTEDHESCDIAIDTKTEKATPQSRLVYTDTDGVVQVARACQASESRGAIDLVRNADLCTVRPGDNDGIFKERARWTYTIGDTIHPVGDCEDTGVTWEYRTVYEGCDIRLDHTLKAAFRQAKKQTYKNSVKIAETACADSARAADRFGYEKSYSACEIGYDDDKTLATTRFQWIYTDEKGVQHEVTGAPGEDGNNCIADPDRTYAIAEDHESCTHDLNYDTMKATPQARLAYRTPDGRLHQVRGCEASKTRDAVDLVKRTDLCPLEHDIAGGKSHQLAKHIYTIDGLSYQADTCARTGTEYAHRKFYGDCQSVVDRKNKHVTRQYQTRIRVDNTWEYVVASCTPDPTTSRITIQTTTDGCDDPQIWHHDIAAGKSYGLERHYYVETGSNVRTYLTQCVVSETTYTHDVVTVGWQHNDEEKANWPLSKVSITTDNGVFVIRESEVLPGAKLIDYIKDRTEDVAPTVPDSDDRRYEGCNAYDRTDRVEVWTRSDNTEYRYIAGDGDEAGPTNVCTWVIGTWTLQSSTTGRKYEYNVCPYEYRTGGDSSETRYSGYPTRIGTYQGSRTLTREDGHVVSTETASGNHTIVGSTGYRNYLCRSYPSEASLPNPMTNPTVLNRWHIALGWK